MGRKSGHPKHRKEKGATLSSSDKHILSEVMPQGMTVTPSKALALLKSSKRFFKSSLGEDGNINLVTNTGYKGTHSLTDLRLMAQQ